jgi:hypothetical protein
VTCLVLCLVTLPFPLQYYHHQVRHGLAPARANILQVMLLWLPSGFRVRMQCFKTLWLPFGLDGYTPEAAAAAPELLIATGPAEVGWLAFHCTVFPIASVLAMLSLLAHVPFGVVWFARQGHRMWLSDSWGAFAPETDPNSRPVSGRPSMSDPMPKGGAANKPGSTDAPRELRQLAFRNSAVASLRLSGRLGGGQSSWQRARRAAMLGLVAAGSAEAASKLAGAVPSSLRAAGGPHRVKFAHSTELAGALVPVHKQRTCSALRGAAAAFVPRLQAACWIILDRLAAVATVGLAAVVGLVAHIVLLVVLAYVLCWTFATRLVFALWCIFVPAAANHSVCLQPSRHCNYWSKASIQAAFAGFSSVGAMLLPQQPQQQQQQPLQPQPPQPPQPLQTHQPVMPQPGTVQDVWDSLGSSGRLAAARVIPAAKLCSNSADDSSRTAAAVGTSPLGWQDSVRQHYNLASKRAQIQAAAGSRAAASLEPPSPQVASDAVDLSSSSKSPMAEQLRQNEAFCSHQQQQQ